MWDAFQGLSREKWRHGYSRGLWGMAAWKNVPHKWNKLVGFESFVLVSPGDMTSKRRTRAKSKITFLIKEQIQPPPLSLSLLKEERAEFTESAFGYFHEYYLCHCFEFWRISGFKVLLWCYYVRFWFKITDYCKQCSLKTIK